jgi:hypothetical protein
MQHRLAALRYSMSKPVMLWLTRNMNSYGQAKRYSFAFSIQILAISQRKITLLIE